MDSTTCKCGCGGEVTPGKMFISGHNGRGRRKPPAVHQCEHCGKSFETRPYMTARKYCSTDCRDQFRRERTGERHPLYKKTSHPCDVCGKEIKVTPKMLNKGKCLCSKECRIENHRRALKGRPKTTNRSGKEAARVRDGGRCVICGFDVVTAVHHLIARKNGGTNDLTNLVTLCPNHHYMAHAGLIPLEVMQEKAKPFEFHEGMPVVTRRGTTGVQFRG